MIFLIIPALRGVWSRGSGAPGAPGQPFVDDLMSSSFRKKEGEGEREGRGDRDGKGEGETDLAWKKIRRKITEEDIGS